VGLPNRSLLRGVWWVAWVLVAARATVTPAVEPETPGLPADVAILPISQGPAVVHPCSREGPVDADYFWQPDLAEVREVERVLLAYLSRPDVTRPRAPLNAYVRQYMGIREHGELLIYVNLVWKGEIEMEATEGHMRDAVDWRSEAVTVCDGGDQFWGIEFDPRTKQLRKARFNGDA